MSEQATSGLETESIIQLSFNWWQVCIKKATIAKQVIKYSY